MIQSLREFLTEPVTLAAILPVCVMLLMLLGVLIAYFRTVSHTRKTDDPSAKNRPPSPYLSRWFGITDLAPLERTGLNIVLAALIVLFFMAAIAAFLAIGTAIWDGVSGDTPGQSLGLGALLVALLSAPFLIWRSVVAQKTLDTTQHGQVTQRINEAVEALGTERTVKYEATDRDGRTVTLERSAPNMEVRIGAIHALGRIARENLGFHVQIMEILCAYVRENAPAKDAVPYEPPKFLVNDIDDDLTPEAIQTYLAELKSGLEALRKKLPQPRTDIQTAMEVLGRRTKAQKRREGGWPDPEREADCLFDRPYPVPPQYPENATAETIGKWRKNFEAFTEKSDRLRGELHGARTYRHDLRRTNLQGYDLSHLDLRGARLDKAQIQGADLWRAQMQGADLLRAQMQGAVLGGAQMQGADLHGAQMQGAELWEAQMQGADLPGAQMQGAGLWRAQMQGAVLGGAQMSDVTALAAATLRGAAAIAVDDTTLAQLRPHWGDIIAFAETLPEGAPAHWVQIAEEDIDYNAFITAWRAFAASLDPPVTIALDYRTPPND